MNEWQQRKTKRKKICVINFDQNNFPRRDLTQKNKINIQPFNTAKVTFVKIKCMKMKI